MTGRIWSTPGTSNPPKTTITQETIVTYSTIEDNVERANPPRVDTDSSSTEGLEEEAIPEKLKGHPKHCLLELDFEPWTPSLDASTWPETVYLFEYRRADGSLAERIIKEAEPFAESTGLLSKHNIEAEVNQNFAGADGTNCTTNPGTQQLRIKWSLDEETWVIMTSLEPHPFADEDRRYELQANYRILDEATRQLEKMLSGTGDTKIIASKILSRLDFVEITLLSCTIVVGQPFSDRQKSENWTKEEQRAFHRKVNDAVRLSWILDDILGGWEQLLERKLTVSQAVLARDLTPDISLSESIDGSAFQF
ncbi:hypothetical protein IFR05_016538 [Cadophora sp. M221]|nr:hypothetical protein IFR05_016538 [Cadophora sp. M221]